MGKQSKFVGRYQVVQGMARGIESALANAPSQSWESTRDRIKADFAAESCALYKQAQCSYPDGSDLIVAVVQGIAPQVQSDTVRKMRVALVSAVENAPRNEVLWREVRRDIISENNAAIGMLAQHAPSALDGYALLDEARSQTGLRIVCKYGIDLDPGLPVEYLARPEANGQETSECEKPEPRWRKRIRRFFDSLFGGLRWVGVLLSIIAAIATLIGVTVWDILPIPIPCDLPIFSLLPRC